MREDDREDHFHHFLHPALSHNQSSHFTNVLTPSRLTAIKMPCARFSPPTPNSWCWQGSKDNNAADESAHAAAIVVLRDAAFSSEEVFLAARRQPNPTPDPGRDQSAPLSSVGLVSACRRQYQLMLPCSAWRPSRSAPPVPARLASVRWIGLPAGTLKIGPPP